VNGKSTLNARREHVKKEEECRRFFVGVLQPACRLADVES